MTQRRSRLVAAGLLVAALAGATAADYTPLEPWEMALRADLIVEGTIVSVDGKKDFFAGSFESEGTFTLRIEDVVAGDRAGQPFESKELVVDQFMDWTCAGRYVDYAPGQRAIFHLRWPREEGVPTRDEPPYVLSAGNEGEYPVLPTGEVLVDAYRWRDAARGMHELNGGKFFGAKVERKELARAIRELRRLVRLEEKPNARWDFEGVKVCLERTEQHFAVYADSSATAARFAKGVREFRKRQER